MLGLAGGSLDEPTRRGGGRRSALLVPVAPGPRTILLSGKSQT